MRGIIFLSDHAAADVALPATLDDAVVDEEEGDMDIREVPESSHPISDSEVVFLKYGVISLKNLTEK